MANMYSVIETMWLEIQQVKETNMSSSSSRSIEMTLIKENKVRKSLTDDEALCYQLTVDVWLAYWIT